jgi:hypothetical protein
MLNVLACVCGKPALWSVWDLVSARKLLGKDFFNSCIVDSLNVVGQFLFSSIWTHNEVHFIYGNKLTFHISHKPLIEL